MIKKIFLLLIVLIICIFFFVFYLIDKIYINKYIKNLEENLNLNISLKESHQLKIIPNLSVLVNFNLEKINNKLFLEDGVINIQRDYNFKKPFFNFYSKNLKIDRLLLENLSIAGEINKYNFTNLLKLTLFPEGYLSFTLDDEDKQSLQFVNIIIQRLNIPKTYKQLSNVLFNFLNDKSSFNSKIIYDDEYIYIDYFKAFNNEYNIEIAGKYNLKNNFANIQAIVEIEKEKIFEINTLGNLDNPEIKVLSSDKSIDMSFNINDINQILSGNFEDVFQNLLTNE
tara:strand:+ start:342 stop:1190 length:849 start_codon:yes stop_codon:yes gene_type:complete